MAISGKGNRMTTKQTNLMRPTHRGPDMERYCASVGERYQMTTAERARAMGKSVSSETPR